MCLFVCSPTGRFLPPRLSRLLMRLDERNDWWRSRVWRTCVFCCARTDGGGEATRKSLEVSSPSASGRLWSRGSLSPKNAVFYGCKSARHDFSTVIHEDIEHQWKCSVTFSIIFGDPKRSPTGLDCFQNHRYLRHKSNNVYDLPDIYGSFYAIDGRGQSVGALRNVVVLLALHVVVGARRS